MSENVIDLLQERGFIENMTHSDLDRICSRPVTLYLGFDPTADGLHLGHLVGIVALARFREAGHDPIALVGGATGLIGDPSGKNTERPSLDALQVAENIRGIRKDLEAVFASRGKGSIRILNNIDWYENLGFLDFLREVGSYFRMGNLLTRDTVKRRLDSGEGIGYKEFSYPLLQAYDFYTLHEKEGVSLQLGGSDQWTNITSGIELIRKKCRREAYGLTYSLLVKSDGTKFGKSEGGAVWLSKDKCSVYDFYQYLIRVPDGEVMQLLRMLTFLPMPEIREIQKKTEDPSAPPNYGQHILAREVTALVHGKEELAVAVEVTKSMAPGGETELNVDRLRRLSEEIPHLFLSEKEIIGKKLIDLFADYHILSGKGEGRRLIRSGGVYLNNERILDENKSLERTDLIDETCFLLAFGKKKKWVIFVAD